MNLMADLPPAIETRLQRLPQGLRDHIERARSTGRELAGRHGIDVEKCDLATACHDLARALPGEDLIAEAKRYGRRIHPVERNAPVLLHGAVAAAWLEHEDGLEDVDVLQAVRWHTTGRKAMGQVAKVAFLADKLDPVKVSQFPFLERVRELAYSDLDRAMLEYLNREIAYLLGMRYLIHPAYLGLRNELMIAFEADTGTGS